MPASVAALADAFDPDPAVLVERLRKLGLPEQVLMLVATQAVHQGSITFLQNHLPSETTNWWKGSYFEPDTQLPPRELKELRKFFKSEYEQMHALMDYDRLWHERDGFVFSSEYYGNLSPEKIKAIETAQTERAAAVEKLGTGSYVPASAQSQKKALDQQYENTVKSVLNPEEFREFMLRRSTAADVVHNKYDELGLSKEEFDRLYAIEDGAEQRRKALGQNVEDPAKAPLSEADQAAVRAVLGDRLEALPMLQDKTYQLAAEFCTSQNLDASAAQALYAYSKSASERVGEANKLEGAERIAALETVMAETRATLRQKLGEDGERTFMLNLEAVPWLRDLESTLRKAKQGSSDSAP